MGNTNRRASTRTAQPSVQWDEANKLRLISENKLAPKHMDKNSPSTKECIECPICFLEFSILNTVHCCKQFICTDCVVQIKGTENKSACPFCGNLEMQVSLMPQPKKAKSNNHSTPVKGKDERSSTPSSGDNSMSARSLGSGPTSLSYTTPEQERKLRSCSLDGTHSSSGSVATKTDREALERQIREQRLQFDERDFAEAAERSRGAYRGSQSGGSASRAQQSPFLASRYRLRTAGTTGAGAAQAGGASQQASSAPERSAMSRYVGGIEGMLQGRNGIGGITSIQQLEDIMLMEAIRLSMQDVPSEEAPAAAPATAAVPSSPAPSSAAAPFTAPAAGPGSQGTTAVNSSAGSGHTSPQRAAASAGGVFTQLARSAGIFRSSSDSAEDAQQDYAGAEEEEDGDGAEGEEEHEDYRMSGASDLLYGLEGEAGSRGSDVLSEEDEQIRLAMALSLTTLRSEQQQQAEGGAAPHPVTNATVPDMVEEPRAPSPCQTALPAPVGLFDAFCIFTHKAAGVVTDSEAGDGAGDQALSGVTHDGPVAKLPASSAEDTDSSA